MKQEEVVKLYTEDRWTLRRIGKKFGKDHHQVSRILKRAGIVTQQGQVRECRTEDHCQKLSEVGKGRKIWSEGKKMSRSHRLLNMRGHLKYEVSVEWLESFEDIDKLIYLNRSIAKKRDYEGFTTEDYKKFIERFYKDSQFNELYLLWVSTGDKWIKPSLDHINSKSSGGSLLLENLQFISWLENRSKVDIEPSEWRTIKQNLHKYFK